MSESLSVPDTVDQSHVRLLADDHSVLGAGMLYSRLFVVTADHCVAGFALGSRILVEFFGTVAAGVLRERVADHDAALIQLVDPVDLLAPIVPLDGCEKDDKWFASYRPTASDPYLDGSVTVPVLNLKCGNGGAVRAAQLESRQVIGNYAGYSGSPVIKAERQRWPTMIGMLIEQFPDQGDPKRASNVLFAATLESTLPLFELINPSNTIAALQYIPEQRVPSDSPVPAASGRGAESRVTELLDAADQVLDGIQRWAIRGVMPPDEVPNLQALVARQVIEKSLE